MSKVTKRAEHDSYSASREYGGLGIDFYVLGLQVSGIGTLVSAINFLVTIVNMRAPGMTMMRLPLFVWTSFISSTLILFAFTPLAAGLALIMLDRIQYDDCTQ